MKATIPGNLLTTAMAVMPHTDVDRALELALSLDVPFWPQLPNYSYYEDMYVQAAEHFPGIILDVEKRTLRFSMDKFIEELEEALLKFENPEVFDISETYSAVYHRFMALELTDRAAIRGQLEGPISFGFNILDQDERPILFDDTVRPFMLDFMAKRMNVQLARLKLRNTNAFMFVDEPGLQFLFSALAGYGDQKAKGDLDQFFSQVDRPGGFICAAIRIGIFCSIWIWTCFLWTFTPTRKFSPLTPPLWENFWIAAALSFGVLYLRDSKLFQRKKSLP